MTVKELIEQLQKFNHDLKVILSKDAEGNDFSPLDDISEGAYVPDSTRGG